MPSPILKGEVGVRGPFDAYDTRESMLQLADDFVLRTGLFDYAHYIRIGAFLARRPFGDEQVKYLKEAYREEDAQSENRPSEPQEDLNAESRDTSSTSSRTNGLKTLHRQYELDMLQREGDRGRWSIFWRQNWRVHALVLCCSLGAAIQGWDETAVNGAQLHYQNTLNIPSPTIIGAINSAPYLMCIVSCFLTGPLNHCLGRKGTVMFCCVFSFASCLGQAFCQTWEQLLICRLLLGFGIGPKSATIPIYAAESVPSEEIRGALVMSWQLWTAFGIMLGYAFTFAFGNRVKDEDLQWRLMIGSPLLAPAVLFFLMMSLPESPRWHLLKARRLEERSPTKDCLQIEEHYENAFHALRTLRHTKIQAARDLFYIDCWLRMDQLPDEFQTSQQSQEQKEPSKYTAGTGYKRIRWRSWFKDTLLLFHQHRCRRAMTAGLIVMALQQVCGVNVHAYYSSSVFKASQTFTSLLKDKGSKLVRPDVVNMSAVVGQDISTIPTVIVSTLNTSMLNTTILETTKSNTNKLKTTMLNTTMLNTTMLKTIVEDRKLLNNMTVDVVKDGIALTYSLGFEVINFLVAIPAVFLIDKVGRRLLLLTTFPWMGVFQLATGLSFLIGEEHRHAFTVSFAYLFCVVYSIGEGPVPLVYASECLPLEVRDTGVGILTGLYWGLNSLMALTWPQMFQSLKPWGSFSFYAALNVIGWVLIVLFVPETSRYTLEELNEVFSQKTNKIMSKGWAQIKWLVTGVGEKKGNYGRWVKNEYPKLVPRFTPTKEQNSEDRGDHTTRSLAANNDTTRQGLGPTLRRPTMTHSEEV